MQQGPQKGKSFGAFSLFGEDEWLWRVVFKHYPPSYQGVFVEMGGFHPFLGSNSW